MEGPRFVALKLLLLHFVCITPIIPSSAFSLDSLINHSPRNTQKLGFRAALRRRDQTTSSSLTDRLQSTLKGSKIRAQHIAINVASSRLPLDAAAGGFLMEVGLGTPPVKFQAIADTGSDLLWTQCKPCYHCYNQSTPMFDPSKSATHIKAECNDTLCDALVMVPRDCNPYCQYNYRYGDGSSTSGTLAYDTLTLGSNATFPHVAFGCGNDNEGEAFDLGGGVVGMGRGNLSIISQMGAMIDHKFSYCLLPFPSFGSSPLFFGAAGGFRGGKSFTTVKSIHNPTYWYVPIRGIMVGGVAVEIPPGTFDLVPLDGGGGGMVLDSGTTYTMLTERAYTPFLSAVRDAVDLAPANGTALGFQLCYVGSLGSGDLKLPSVGFDLEGGVDLVFPRENVFVQAGKELLCLAVIEAPKLAPSILGNIQQQNFHFLFDNERSTVTFKPEKCSSL